MCERLGAAGWETTSAATGDNVHMVFDLCISAAMEARVKCDNKKDRLVRPNTLKLSSLATNLDNNKNHKTWTNNNNNKYSDHVYENPENISRAKVKKSSVIPRQYVVSPSSVILEQDDDTRNLCLRTTADQSVFSPQSSKSGPKSPLSPTPTLLSPTPSSSDIDGVPRR